MMKQIVAVAVVLLCANSFALDSDLKMSTEVVKTKMEGISTALDKAIKEQGKYQGLADSVGKDLKALGCVLDSDNRYDCTDANPTKISTTATLLENLARRHNTLQNIVEGENRKIAELKPEHEKLMASLIQNREPVAMAQAMQIQSDLSWLLHKFSDVRDKNRELGDQLDDLENSIDQTNLGVYLQDKFGLLLSSNAICNAYQRCKTGERKELDKSYLKEVFPEMNDESSRSGTQWYDKAAGRRPKASK